MTYRGYEIQIKQHDGLEIWEVWRDSELMADGEALPGEGISEAQQAIDYAKSYPAPAHYGRY